MRELKREWRMMSGNARALGLNACQIFPQIHHEMPNAKFAIKSAENMVSVFW
jgi:hypothetical protein